jgi:hypothetical protein
MRYLLTALAVLPLCLVLLSACEVRKTQEGQMPKVDVKTESGQLPKYDVDVKKTQEGEMPKVDVDVQQKAQLPKYDVKPADVEAGVQKKEVEVPVPYVEVKPKDQPATPPANENTNNIK